jgi:hypothetical protein
MMKEMLRRLRHKKTKVKLTVDDKGKIVEHAMTAMDAIPGWGEAAVPEGLSKEDMIARSLDIALGLLHHSRAMMAADLANTVTEVWKVQANYTYEDFIQAAEGDPRFQVSLGQLIALANEADPWNVVLEQIEVEETEINGQQGCEY